MVVKFHDSGDKTEKVVIIFDNTTVTCEISDSMLIALVTHTGNASVDNPYSVYHQEFRLQRKVQKLKVNETVEEEPLQLEKWMLHPAEWM
jgi:hypothetical protein